MSLPPWAKLRWPGSVGKPRDLALRSISAGRDGGEWGLPDDYLARIEALEDEEYSTTFSAGGVAGTGRGW